MTGYIISFSFVSIIILIATILGKLKKVGIEGTRKLVHISVSNWWFIAMLYFVNPISASVVPFCFIIINYLSYKKQLFSAIERGEGKKDLGTVYYSVSLFLLVLLTFSLNKPEIGLLGILIMGYGDGFAALVGKKWGTKPLAFNKNKTVEGSITVFILSIIITFLILTYYYPQVSLNIALLISLSMGVFAFLIEALTPNGFDNLTLPLITSGIFYYIVNNLI